jgi:hypothetical protein
MAANIAQNNQYVYVSPQIPFGLYVNDEFVKEITVAYIRRIMNFTYNSYYTANGNTIRAIKDSAAALQYAEAHGNDNAAARQHASDAGRHANDTNRHAHDAYIADKNAKKFYNDTNIGCMAIDTVVDTGVAVAIITAANSAANAALAARHASIAAQNSRQLAAGAAGAAGALGNGANDVGTNTSFAEMNADFARRLAANAVRVHQRANANAVAASYVQIKN